MGVVGLLWLGRAVGHVYMNFTLSTSPYLTLLHSYSTVQYVDGGSQVSKSPAP